MVIKIDLKDQEKVQEQVSELMDAVEQLSKALNRVSELESELHWATIGMSMTLESGNEKEVD